MYGWPRHSNVMNPPIMMNVHIVRSTAFLFLATTAGAGMIFSPCLPSPGAMPSSNLTLFLLGLVGVGTSLGPEGEKSLGVLRLRLEGRTEALGVGREGRSGANAWMGERVGERAFVLLLDEDAGADAGAAVAWSDTVDAEEGLSADATFAAASNLSFSSCAAASYFSSSTSRFSSLSLPDRLSARANASSVPSPSVSPEASTAPLIPFVTACTAPFTLSAPNSAALVAAASNLAASRARRFLADLERTGSGWDLAVSVTVLLICQLWIRLLL